jgi:hypothetical protein
MNKKLQRISQGGLAVKTLNEQLNTNVIYKVVADRGLVWYAIATSATEAQEFDTELEARIAA